MNEQAIRKIVIDDAVPYAKAIFSHLGEVTTLPGREIQQSDLIDADALIVRSRTQVNATLLDGTSIKFVGSTVVGLDHVDQDYLTNKGIHFYSAQGCNANSVAEFIITALFELAEAFNFDLTQKTLGIIGVGHVGSLVYDKACKLNIRCLLNDPPKLEQHPELSKQHPYVSLEECLQADIITVHTPLTSAGKHPTVDLISEDKLKNIKPHQIIINAARGGIIDEPAWIDTPTLANVIDCWNNEPYIDEALYKTAWLATPHIAGHSLDAKVAGSSMVYENLCQFWDTAPNKNWKSELPTPPEALSIEIENPEQTIIKNTLKATHDIFNDDHSIRDENIQTVHKKYENYRRNFPIYREWKHQKFHTTPNQNINKLLFSLDFNKNQH